MPGEIRFTIEINNNKSLKIPNLIGIIGLWRYKTMAMGNICSQVMISLFVNTFNSVLIV
jgi:hypothetical protein